jgi:sulfane dehydrogenase subunit SoxC
MAEREGSRSSRPFEKVAGGGLLDRRTFLGVGTAAIGALAGGLADAAQDSSSPGYEVPEWMKAPGRPMGPYGAPSPSESAIQRTIQARYGTIAPGAGASTTPLQALEGTITPNGLHFERHHSGIPEIDPARHSLLLHGLVKRPLSFSIDSLLRYPMTTRTCFIECSGNSAPNIRAEAMQISCGEIHGLVSCSEWSGVPLNLLLDEAGVDPRGRWLLVEGADAAAMSRSVPLDLASTDGILALFQNGERIRPEQGYPLRLVLPGLEGNVNVKWLRRIEVRDGPTHTRDETSKYTDLLPGGKAAQFTLEMGVKSIITRPSAGMAMQGPGRYEISGLAWSGAGRITRVDVSADGGKTWAPTALQEPVLSKSLTRFRIPFEWKSGRPVHLQSRAADERGNTQPNRDEWSSRYASGSYYHYNAIQSWKIEPDGRIRNTYE